jgi:hypothetical protein
LITTPFRRGIAPRRRLVGVPCPRHPAFGFWLRSSLNDR